MSTVSKELQKLWLYVDHSGLYIYLKAAYEVMINQNQYNAESIWVKKVLVGAGQIYIPRFMQVGSPSS